MENAEKMTLETVAQSWLVLTLTGSPLLMGISNACRSIPMFFGLVGGLVADRFDRTKVLLFSRVVNLALTTIMAFLVATGMIEFWQIIVITLLTGLNNSLTGPAQQAFLVDLVGKRDLTNAYGLTRTSTAIIDIFGALASGFFIEWYGISSCYYLSVTIRAISLAAFCMVRTDKTQDLATEKSHSALRDIAEGIRYIRGAPSLVGLLAIATYWNLFISEQGFKATLLPIFAKNILDVGASGYGLLVSAFQIGILAGSLTVSSLGNIRHKGWVVIIGAEMIGVTLLLFAAVRWFALSLVIWASVGLMCDLYSGMSQILLLTESSDEMRGRVMGARSQVVCVLPINAIWAGAVSELLGAAFAMSLGGFLWLISVAATAILIPKMRKSE